MCIRSKRILSMCLAAGLIMGPVGSLSVRADKSYDATNVGIIGRVDDYIEKKGDTAVEELLGLIEESIAEEKAWEESLKEAAVGTEAYIAVEEVSEEATLTDAAPEEAKAEVKEETKEEVKEEDKIKKEEKKETEEEAAAVTVNTNGFKQFEGKAVATVDSILNIRKESSPEAEIVGTLGRCGICTVIEKGDEWTLIESGPCKGYVKTSYLAFGDDAAKWFTDNGYLPQAVIAADGLNVREKADASSNSLTTVTRGETYKILSTAESGWTKIEVSSDIKGYVNNEYVEIGFRTVEAVAAEEKKEEEKSEESTEENTEESTEESSEADTSEETTEAEESDNESGYAAPAGQAGQDIADYAVQFEGNPYVYGGTSLTGGADCSGFVMSVYAQFGYSLPRVADDQANVGTEVSLSDIQPGDLLFYGSGYIGHVAIYIGNGQIVHAASSSQGIIIQNYDYHTPCKATRIVNN